MSYQQQQHREHLARRERLYRPPAARKDVAAEPPVPAPEPPAPPTRDWLAVKTKSFNPAGVAAIVKATAAYYDVPVIDILAKRRAVSVVRPRQVAMYLAKTLTLRSLPEIGRRMGGRDHTTVLHSVRKIAAMVETDQKLAQDIENIKGVIALQHQRSRPWMMAEAK